MVWHHPPSSILHPPSSILHPPSSILTCRPAPPGASFWCWGNLRAVREMSGFPRHFCLSPRSVFVVTVDPTSVEALQAAVATLGFELVDMEVVGPAARREVRLRIDRPGGSAPGEGVTTDDCRRVSRALEERFDASGVVGTRYVLEVSSPGIERPVRFAEHWRRYVGRNIHLRARGLSGTVTARIVAVPDEEQVTVAVGPEQHTLALAAIKRATLVVDWSTIGGAGTQENR